MALWAGAPDRVQAPVELDLLPSEHALAPAQHFCSYLCSTAPTLDDGPRTLDRLPSVAGAPGFEVRNGKARLVVFPAKSNPLHRWHAEAVGEYLLFVQGDFYEETDLSTIRELVSDGRIDDTRLVEWIRRRNGVFSGVILHRERREYASFSDLFGFGLQYIADSGSELGFSSHIWPLIDLFDTRREIDPAGAQETLLFGYPIADRTMFSHVSVNPPATLILGEGEERRRVYLADHEPRSHMDRRRGSWRDVRGSLEGGFASHFESMNRLAPDLAYQLALSGGHDSRVVLNAMIANGIRPDCFTGFSRKRKSDDARAMAVGRAAGVKTVLFDYSEDDEVTTVDCNAIADGSDTGTWSMNLARQSPSENVATYFGTSGDLLSFNWHIVPANFPDHDAMSRSLFEENYEYSGRREDFDRIFPDIPADDLDRRYRATFPTTPGDPTDPTEDYQVQWVNTRNFRRIRMFMQGSYLAGNPVHPFHDRRVASAYRNLPYYWLFRQRAHVRLCYSSVRGHALIPASAYPILPVALEPALQRHVKTITRRVIKPVLSLRGAATRQAEPTGERARGLEIVRASMSRLGWDVDAFDRFYRADLFPARLAMRANHLANLLEPERILSRSSLVGEKRIVPLSDSPPN